MPPLTVWWKMAVSTRLTMTWCRSRRRASEPPGTALQRPSLHRSDRNGPERVHVRLALLGLDCRTHRGYNVFGNSTSVVLFVAIPPSPMPHEAVTSATHACDQQTADDGGLLVLTSSERGRQVKSARASSVGRPVSAGVDASRQRAYNAKVRV